MRNTPAYKKHLPMEYEATNFLLESKDKFNKNQVQDLQKSSPEDYSIILI